MARYTMEGDTVNDLVEHLARIIIVDAAEQVVAAMSYAMRDKAPHLSVVDGEDTPDESSAGQRRGGNARGRSAERTSDGGDGGDGWLRMEDAAEKYKLPPSRIYRLGKEGRVRTKKGPRRAILYSAESLERLAS